MVSFPRDWLGPRDQLVPFGKEVESSQEPASRGASDAPPRPPRAADFWDEGAAAIHDAVEAADESDAEAPASTTTAPARRPRGRALVAASVIALACAVVVLVKLAGPGSHESRAQLGSARELSVGRPFLALGISGAMARAEVRVERAAQRQRRATRRSRPHSASAIEVSVHQTPPSSASAYTARSVSAPAGSGSSSSGRSSGGSGGGASRSGVGSAPSTGVSSGGSGGPSSSAGPTGEGALVGPGSTPSG